MTHASLTCPLTYTPVCGVSQRIIQGTKIQEILRTYPNRCMAESVQAKNITDGACSTSSRLVESDTITDSSQGTSQSSQVTTFQTTKSNQATIPVRVPDPTRDLAAMLTTNDQTLAAMWTSIVNKVDQTDADKKTAYLTKLVEVLKGQRDSIDKGTETFQRLSTLIQTIDQFLGGITLAATTSQHASSPVSSSQSTTTNILPSQPSASTNTIKPTLSYSQQLGSIMIESNYQWIWTQDGTTLRGKRIDQEMIIHLGTVSSQQGQGSTNTDKASNQPIFYSGAVIATGTNFDGIIYSYVRDAVCPAEKGIKRTIAYQKVLSKVNPQSAINTDIVLVMCRGWRLEGKTYQPINMKVKPIKLDYIMTPDSLKLITMIMPDSATTYTSTIVDNFDSSVHNLFLGKDTARYQTIIQTLTETNSDLVSQ